MMSLPEQFALRHRPAETDEVRSWSYGALRAVRNPDATSRERRRGTLDDEAIFGPTTDEECACGKYRGPRFRGIICDRCGVKLGSTSMRRQRFGHVNLPDAIRHPLGPETATLSALPVLPGAYWTSPAGPGLADRYDEIIRACAAADSNRIRMTFETAIALLLPIALGAEAWCLGDAADLARGLALCPIDGEPDPLASRNAE